jgi:hypothetical protein
MGRRGRELAERFRTALDTAEAERRRQEEEQQRRLAEGSQEREALLKDLADIGRSIGHIAVSEQDGGITFRYNERFLHFEPMGEGDRVRVTFDDMGDDEHRLYREPALGNRWVWSMRRRGREDRLPLFDNGLEELLVLGLKLPRPGEVAVTAQVQPTLEAAIPSPRKIEDQGDGGDELPGESKRSL